MTPDMVISEQDKKIINSGRCAPKNGTSSVGGFNFMPFGSAPNGTYDKIFSKKSDRYYTATCSECGKTFAIDDTRGSVEGKVPNCYHH